MILPILRFIDPINCTVPGKIKKIGGHCFTSNCSHLSTKLIDKARINFNKLLNEVWIDKNTLISKGEKPGFGLSIWASTVDGVIFSADK